MKKTVSIILLLVIFVCTLPCVNAAEEVTYDLSLAQAIELAFTDNERIIANEHKQLAGEIAINSAYLARKPYKKMAVNVSSNFDLYCLKEGYYIESAEMAHRLSVKEAERIESSIAYSVTEAYYNLVLMKKLTQAADNAVKLAQTNKDIVDKQYSIGLIAHLDYENASLATMSAQSALDTYRMNEKIAEENLKILLNIDDENVRINPTDEIECGEYSSDCNADAENALSTRYDVMALRESMNLAYQYYDLSSVLTKSSATYNSAYASYLEAQYNYNSTSKLIKLSIKTAYNNIVNSLDKMNISQKQYEIKLKEYEAAKIKYELGVIANIELTKAINDLYDAQVSYANAKLSYRMAIEKYKYEITTGL